MDDNWDFYQRTVDGQAASVALDLALKDSAPDARRPVLLVVSVPLRHPHPDTGMSTDAEFDVLIAIEEALCASLRAHYGAIQAGRITTAGRRDFYFYCAAAPGLEQVAGAALAAFPAYAWRSRSHADPAWRGYFDTLYPDSASQRWIKDKSLIDALRHAGDQPLTLRPVAHFSYFPNATRRAAFTDTIEKAGFTVRSLSDLGSATPNPFGVVYELAQRPELGAMADTTALLTRLAHKHGGEYDGWESPVMRSAARPWWRFWS
jgi:hypothetical protein